MSTYIVNPVVVRMTESAKGAQSGKGSIYQSIVAMGFRSRQINDYIKMQLTAKMVHVETPNDEESDVPNYDKMEISKQFDYLPKPTFMAMREMLDGKLNYNFPKPEKKDSL